MEEIKVGLLQMSSVVADVEANCKKIENIINKELERDTNVLVLPEVWSVGWSCDKFISTASPLYSSDAVKFLSNTAKKYNINIIGGSVIIKEGNKYYNTCPVLNKEGQLVATYSKSHLFSYYGANEGDYITAGSEPQIVELDGVKFGLTICYDIRFPEIYRAYARAGADVLVNCAAWGANKSTEWEVMTKSRAVENQCYMLALTQSGKVPNGQTNLGVSRIIGYRGEELNIITKEEGIIHSVLKIDELYQFREKCPILNDIKDNYEVRILCKK